MTTEANELSIELIKSQVIPILEAFARDITCEFIAKLAPQEEDFARVFIGEAIEVAHKGYQEMWMNNLRIQHPTSLQSEIRFYAAPAGLLSTENDISNHFPGGYRRITNYLNPQKVWITWKYLSPGTRLGLFFDGLVWVDDHWAWFPKPYRVLSELAPTLKILESERERREDF